MSNELNELSMDELSRLPKVEFALGLLLLVAIHEGLAGKEVLEDTSFALTV